MSEQEDELDVARAAAEQVLHGEPVKRPRVWAPRCPNCSRRMKWETTWAAWACHFDGVAWPDGQVPTLESLA